MNVLLLFVVTCISDEYTRMFRKYIRVVLLCCYECTCPIWLARFLLFIFCGKFHGCLLILLLVIGVVISVL
jgi:hypothetical protein